MTMNIQFKSRLLHGIAKIDAGESVANYAPLRTRVLPLAGLGLGLAAMGYNYQYAADEEARKKVLLRDGLVLGGIAATSVAASLLVNRTRLPHQVAEKISQAGNALARMLPGKSMPVQAAAQKAHHHCHTGHTHRHPFAKDPGKMLASLFQSDKHSHGGEAAVALTLLSAIPIFLGGIPAGTIADWLNQEDWRETLPMKLKEGTFQFLGNIMVCTVSILGFSALGKAAARQLWKAKPVQNAALAKTRQHLQQLAKSPKNTLGLIPTKLTQDVEAILLEHRDQPAAIGKALQRYFKPFEGEWIQFYQRELAPLINRGTVDRESVHAKIRTAWIEPKMRQALQHSNRNDKAIANLARIRFNGLADTLGVLAGVFSGVVGGAWISNQVNEAATKAFKWPEGHITSGLFQHSHHHSPTIRKTDDTNPGWLAGKVGERGIHWYDGILHLDDIPSALYIGGMHAVESMIQLLYGISGFLAGTAGIDYSQPKSKASLSLQPQWPITMPYPGLFVQHLHPIPPQSGYQIYTLPTTETNRTVQRNN